MDKPEEAILLEEQPPVNGKDYLKIEKETVEPTEIEIGEIVGAYKKFLDITKSTEYVPPEGRNLFFEDGERRIDYVLAWEVKNGKDPNIHDENARKVFCKNLINEGLQLEESIHEETGMHFMKIHTPWEVLTRYAEIMKIRSPMKEVPEEIQTASVWEYMSDTFSKVLTPCEQDPEKLAPIPKMFTYVFQRDKEYLFAIPNKKDLFFNHATRSRVVDYILRRKKYSDDPRDTYEFGIKRMMNHGMYSAAFPLHEGSWRLDSETSMRNMLFRHWAHPKNFYKFQPLDYIRIYFGEKIGLYFAWLGYYTYMLIPASILGLIVFLYGLITMEDNTVGQETCQREHEFTMCPLCDKRCHYYNLSSACTHVKASHMFDNPATVFFAIFMSFWGTIFLEFWKREEAVIQFKWNLLNFEEEEEPPRPEYLAKLSSSKYKKKHRITGKEEPFVPFWRKRVPLFSLSFVVMMFLILMAVAVVVGVIVYRMALLTALYWQNQPLLYRNASLVTSATAAVINLIIIFILNFIYGKVAVRLTDMECLRTQSEYDSSLTIKLYCLQFINYYSSIFYIAFIKGKFIGYPGNYNTLFGARQEECQPGGCLIELCIQLAIIMVGKQLLQNTLVEIFLPRLKIWIKGCFDSNSEEDKTNRAPWEKDYRLEPLGPQGLFYEYLEMLLQFGFVTIFVAAFPLAPLFAWINNLIEIRADANKFVTQLRRPMGARAQNIGVWYNVLYAVSRFAVVTNALIISFTSNFIPRLVYRYMYSPDQSLAGFVNHSLSYFNVSDFKPTNRPDDPDGQFTDVQLCRYRDYREPPWAPDRYEYTAVYWHVLAARFIFVFVFQNFVFLATGLLAYMIPDMPRKIKEQARREAYLANEIILKVELDLAKGGDGELTEEEKRSIRRRARASIFNRAMSSPAERTENDEEHV